jgi:transcriptional regulator with PAS, ATPase and Fis domain
MDRTGQFHYQAPILKHVGTVYYKQGKYDEALAELSKSLENSTKAGAKSEIKDCYLLLSDIYVARSEYKTALNYRVKYDTLMEEVFQQDISAQLSELQKKYEQSTLQASSLRYEKSLITDELKKTMNTGFVGVSNGIKEVQKLALEAAAHKDTRVLITGESGVGKEIVARLIHYSDALNRGRFVDVNCCAIPESMAESEFFGYVRGAFTGALNAKIGILEEADNGTLFLDEIGDMPMLLQSKLLRVLETRQIKRLGSNKEIPVNFRLVSATNKKISELITENKFRVDLMYRINALEIFIPPLRERKDDIEPLLDYYLAEYANRMNKTVPSYDNALLNWLCDYSFPGNVRELRNMIERVMIFLKGDKLSVADFACQMPSEHCVISKAESVRGSKMQDIEENALLKELKACNGNQTQAAKNLGMPYSTFKRKYKKLRTP